MFHFIHELLDQAAQRWPEKTAITGDDGSVTYRELAAQTEHAAAWLRRRRIGRGDRVAILLPNGIPVLVLALAASRVGAIFCVINEAVKSYNLDHILSDCAPRLIVTSRARFESEALGHIEHRVVLETEYQAILDTPVSPRPSPAITIDPCFLVYTSGSTAKPKAVVEGHRSVLFAAWAIQQRLQIRESDVVGNFLPLAFDYGLYQAFLSFQVGATLALGRESHVGPLLLKKLREWSVSVLPMVPSIANALIRLASRSAENLPALRVVTNSGAQLPKSYIEQLNQLFPACQVFVMFGLTECKRVSIMLPSEYAGKADSVGRPLDHVECMIIGPSGERLAPGEKGELVVRGPNVMLGYWNAPEQTALRYRVWGPRHEVALFTGDVCSMDADGFLYFHGRNDDIYKQRGHRVSSIEIEGAATDLPGVTQAAVIPHRDDVGATLIVAGEVSCESVLVGLRARLEEFKVPTRIVRSHSELPLTPNRKVDKKALEQMLSEGALT